MSNRDFFLRVLIVAVTVILLLGFWSLRSIFMLGFAALMIAIGVSIPARWLQLRGLSRGIAVAIAGTVVTVVIIVLVLWIVPTLIRQLVVIILQLPDMFRASVDYYDTVRTSNQYLSNALPALDFSSIEQLEGSLGLRPESLRTLARTMIGTGAYSFMTGLGLFGALVVNLLFVAFIAAFFLIDPVSYIKASLYLVPRTYHARTLEIWNDLYQTLTTWISAQFLSISITAALVFLILGVLLGMPFPLVVAVFAGIATFVPNIGAFLPIIPITIFTLAEKPSWLLIYIIVYLLIQLSESNIITPLIVKSELDIPAAGLMLFQLVAAALFGALGLLFAVPMLAILITLVREIYTHDLLGVGPEPITVMSMAGKPLRLQEAKAANPDHHKESL